MLYRTLNPTTGELKAEYPLATAAQIESALARSQQGFAQWRRLSISERGTVLMRIADRLDIRAEALALLMAREMGKPIAQGEAECCKCAHCLRYFADFAEVHLAPVPHPSDASESCVVSEPLGAVLGIMPWNFPFWQLFRFAAGAWMAGNVVVMKHAPNTPGCARAIVDLLTEAEAPEGMLESLFLDNDQAAKVIADRRICAVSLTGSSRAGRAVAAIAGESLKKVVLELGGSDPFIVFADADLEAAVEVAVTSRCLNNGQSCIAAKRFIVERSIADVFTEQFTQSMRSRIVGDPLERTTQIGPMARADLREALERQVNKSVAMGAKLLCGGECPEGPGFFYPPTVLIDAPATSPARCEELFGPVAMISDFEDEAQALALANETEYGLGASLWTGDDARARRLIGQIETGNVFVNGLVKSDPRLPFGGIKDSGYGRELASAGLLEFTNQKTVWIK